MNVLSEIYLNYNFSYLHNRLIDLGLNSDIENYYDFNNLTIYMHTEGGAEMYNVLFYYLTKGTEIKVLPIHLLEFAGNINGWFEYLVYIWISLLLEPWFNFDKRDTTEDEIVDFFDEFVYYFEHLHYDVKNNVNIFKKILGERYRRYIELVEKRRDEL